MAWYLRQRFADLDLPAWFMPDVDIQRLGTDCEEDPCGFDEGACCVESTGACLEPLTQGDCESIPTAVWQGPNTDCADIECPVLVNDPCELALDIRGQRF